MEKRRLIIVLLFASFFNSYAQTEQPIFIKDSLDIYIHKALEQWDVPGAAVAIIKNGKKVVLKGYGVLEKGKDKRIDENTLFLIGSNTKAFTGTALAMLENEGKCTLEDKVKKYLPDFSMQDEWVESHLNLTDILSHRIGMRTFQGDFIYWTSNLSREEVIEKFGRLTPKYDFRARYGYTNAGFTIAGECIKKISGKSWEEYVNEKIIKPLEMDNTYLLSAQLPESGNIARPHTFVNGVMTPISFPQMDNLAPAASISSSISDLSHWIIAQLDSGRYEGNTIIPFSVIQKTRKPNTIVGRSSNPFDRSSVSLYGLGWDIEDYKGRQIISHTGGVDGFVTSVTLIPSENLGIVVLTNSLDNLLYIALKWQILDNYLNLPYQDYSQKIFKLYSKQSEEEKSKLKALQDTVNMHLKPALDLNEYTGRYIHTVYGNAEISTDGNNLKLTLQHHPDLTGKLECLGGNRFLCTYSIPTFGIEIIPFNIEDGEVNSFTLSVSGFVDYEKYEFIKD